jgi:hypothetical protein
MKKTIYLLVFFATTLHGYSATRYEVSGGTGNWNSTTNWSTSSGGASGASFPTSSDDVIFDANSGNLSVNVVSACLSFNSTGYTGTLTMSSILTVTGNITLGASMLFSGASQFIVNATSTITTNGVAIPYFVFGAAGNFTVTLNDDLNCTNNSFNFSGSYTINGHTIYIGGNLSCGAALPVGTTTFTMNGTGAVSGLRMANAFVINTSGTITLSGSNQWNNSGSSFTYVAGTIVSTGSTCVFVTTTITAGSGCVFNNVVFNSTGTTINSDIYCNGNVSDGTSGWVVNGLYTIYVGGNLSSSVAGSGTASFIQNGTGTLSGRIDNSITINTAGTITLGSVLSRNGGTFKYTAGTVVTTNNTLTIVGLNTTLDLSGVTLNNMATTNNATVTLNSNLIATGTLTATQSIVFAGTGNLTLGGFMATTTGRLYVLQAGNTYTINNSLTVTSVSGSNTEIKSSSSSVRAILTLPAGASQNIRYCNGTWIDSSGGQTIYSLKGTLSNTINWSKPLNNFNTFN